MNIGILISPSTQTSSIPLRKQLPEPNFYEQLIEVGRSLDQFVYVFSATQYNPIRCMLSGYCYENKKWYQKNVPLPDIVIDRTFHQNKIQAQKHAHYIKQLELNHHFFYLNAQLPHKLTVYNQLKAIFPSIIPPTIAYDSFHTLLHWLEQYKEGIILKPQAGMQGKGIIHIKKANNLFVITGRQINNQPFSTTLSSQLSLQKWLLYFKQNNKYLLQPFYSFLTNKLEPFDIRVLMQKGKNGYWQYSGDAARIGMKHTLTSNLHGGGKCMDSNLILNELFEQTRVTQLLFTLQQLSRQIVEQLEACFGRFGELALDFGITQNGDIVLLECNSKPGRQAFMSNPSQAEQVVLQPLNYAQYLYEHYIEHHKMQLKNRSTSII